MRMVDSGAAGRTMLVVRVPPEAESIHYRAYAQPLDGGTVLDWALSRFIAASPIDIDIACVCERSTELRRLQAACERSRIRFICEPAETEVHLCQQLMD